MFKTSRNIFYFCIISLIPSTSVFAAQWSLNQIITNNSTLIVQDQSTDGIDLTLSNMSATSSITGRSGCLRHESCGEVRINISDFWSSWRYVGRNPVVVLFTSRARIRRTGQTDLPTTSEIQGQRRVKASHPGDCD